MKETFRSLVFVVCIVVLCSVLFGCTTDTNAFSRNSSIANDAAYQYVDDSHEPATVSMPSNDTSHTASEEQAFIPQVYNDGKMDDLFSAPFQTATGIIEASIGDINGDGMSDVYLISGFLDYCSGTVFPDTPYIEYLFLQLDNGLFYLYMGEASCGTDILDKASPEATPVFPPLPSEILDIESLSVMMAYLDFLHNNVMFYEYYNNRQTLHAYENFADFLHQEDGITLELKRIAIIDIYGDGIKELILSMKHPASASIREIVLVLTCDDNTLYGIRLTQRSFSRLKKDGSYFSSEVAPGHWGIMRLQYSSGTFWFDETRSPSYYESYNEFWDFVEEQEQKENAEWVTYSEASIAEDFADAWEVNTIS